MSKKLTIVALTISLVFSLSVFAKAQSEMLPPQVEQALHDVKVLKIDSGDKVSKIWELSENPDIADIIRLEVHKSDLTSPQIQLLKHWVKSGHMLWVDPFSEDIAKEFGLEPKTIRQPDTYNKFRAKDEHKVLTDVKLVDLKLGNEGEGAVAHYLQSFESGYDVALLENKSGDDIAVLKYFGSGVVISLHKIEKGAYDSMRFYVNLLEFGAGYPVPPSVVSGTVFTEPPKKYDRIILQNGDVLSGEVLTKSFEISTNYGEFTFSKEKTTTIFQGANLYRLSLETGDQLTGTLKNEEISVNLVTGKEKVISFKNVKRIVLSGN